MKAKAVYLEWVDSTSFTQNLWKNTTMLIERAKVDRCKTIGFIVCEDDEQITIVNSFDFGNESASGDITIPKCAIRKRRVVSWKK